MQLNMLEHCSSKYVSLNRRGEIEKGSNTVALMSALLAMDKKHREVFHSLGIDSFDLFYADTQKLKHLLPAYPWP